MNDDNYIVYYMQTEVFDNIFDFDLINIMISIYVHDKIDIWEYKKACIFLQAA